MLINNHKRGEHILSRTGEKQLLVLSLLSRWLFAPLLRLPKCGNSERGRAIGSLAGYRQQVRPQTTDMLHLDPPSRRHFE